MRILFVSYYFAPYNSVGAVRATRMAEWLQRLGHEVFVLTARGQPYPVGLECSLPAERIVATTWSNRNAPVDLILGRRRVAASGYAGGTRRGAVGQFARFYRTVMHWPDAQAGWRRAAIAAGRSLMRGMEFDLIYASAPPFTGFAVAAALGKENGVRWIAEYRDLWTANHGYDYPGWRRAVEARQEARVVSSAAGAVTVSRPLAQRLRRDFAGPIEVVTNGYDAQVNGAPGRKGMPFELVYTGSLYDKAYDVDALVAAVEAAALGPDELRVRMRGRNLGSAEIASRGSPAAPSFDIGSTVARAEALRLQAGSDALLFFCWNGAAGEGVLTAKLFEYLGARRPILAIGDPESETGRLIARLGRGFVSRNPAAIAAWLREAVSAKRSKGRAADLPAQDLEPYSREAQARVLDAFLSSVAAG